MKPITFKDKTAVITGAGSGMGLLTSRELVRSGATVVMCDINGEAIDAAAAELNASGPGTAVPLAVDVRKFADAERAAALALEKTGRIDLVIPFAGGYEARMCNSQVPFFEQPVDVIDWGIDVNLKGAVYFARACMPAMVKGGNGGVICCLGSTSGFEGDVNGAMYGTAKSGLFTFVKALALAGAPYGIRAFCVTPGPVMTRPGMAGMKTLLNTQAQPQELVDYILYLCSENGRCVTGSNHGMDCGRLTMKPQV